MAASDHHGQRVRPAGSESPSDPVSVVIYPRGCGQHFLPHSLGHAISPIEGAGNRRYIHVTFVRYGP